MTSTEAHAAKIAAAKAAAQARIAGRAPTEQVCGTTTTSNGIRGPRRPAQGN